MSVNLSSEIVTTAQFVNHLQGVRSYLQSRGASGQIYIFLHELDNIALHDKLSPKFSFKKRMTHFIEFSLLLTINCHFVEKLNL